MARKWQRRDLNPGPQLQTSILHGFSPSCRRPLFLKRGFLVFKSHLGEQGLTKAWPTCPSARHPAFPQDSLLQVLEGDAIALRPSKGC